MDKQQLKFVGIETGGEHMVVAISEGDKIISRWECATTSDSKSVIEKVIQHIKEESSKIGGIDSIGIASFGPIDPNPSSKTYGYITTTPKEGWRMTDVVGPIKAAFGESVPIGFDTDVNGAAVAELAARPNLSNCAYITVGTGVGAGIIVDGHPVHGMLHPESGHIMVPRADGDTFVGSCPFHGCCVEGMVASGALTKRLGIVREKLPEVPDDDPVWPFVAHYIAQLCAILVMTVSPEIIVLGGGIMKRKCLFPLIRIKMREILNGYIKTSQILDGDLIDSYIVPASFGSDTGVRGALELANMAYKQKNQF